MAVEYATVVKNKVLGWDSEHPLHEKFTTLWEELVPADGEAQTIEGELIRCVGRLVYEWCNNGNCNAAESEHGDEEVTCELCNGDGIYQGEECQDCSGGGTYMDEFQYDPEMTPYYKNMIEFIRKHLPHLDDALTNLVALIEHPSLHYNYKYDERETIIYNTVTEPVVEYVWNKLKSI